MLCQKPFRRRPKRGRYPAPSDFLRPRKACGLRAWPAVSGFIDNASDEAVADLYLHAFIGERISHFRLAATGNTAAALRRQLRHSSAGESSPCLCNGIVKSSRPVAGGDPPQVRPPTAQAYVAGRSIDNHVVRRPPHKSPGASDVSVSAPASLVC